MIKADSAPQMGTAEKILLSLDGGALGALYRVAIGFVALPAMSLLLGSDGSDWRVVPFLLAILLLLRVVPALIRKLLPFPGVLRDAWAARRRTAKRYDSYQWRKLMWIGAGLATYTIVSGEFSAARIVVGATCLLAGATAMARWRAVCPSDVARLSMHKAQGVG